MRILTSLRANFLTGLVVVAPVGLTVYIVWTGIGIIDSWVLPLIPERYQPATYFGVHIHGAGLIVFLIFTILVGYVAKGLFGRWILGRGEMLVSRMPIVRSVYRGLKQIAEAVVDQSTTTFDRVCLVQYPRKGIWAIAFYSNDARAEIREHLGKERKMISVFLPTTPNPTSGFLLFVPEEDVIYAEMSVEDAAKLVISAGLVYPTEETRPPPILQKAG
ncbi:MAG: DUF502 domain-containing protein [Rhodobacteraceae bacterium]|nr:DUF502 domain-containing protein [Paracoccaceae bacterium]